MESKSSWCMQCQSPKKPSEMTNLKTGGQVFVVRRMCETCKGKAIERKRAENRMVAA